MISGKRWKKIKNQSVLILSYMERVTVHDILVVAKDVYLNYVNEKGLYLGLCNILYSELKKYDVYRSFLNAFNFFVASGIVVNFVIPEFKDPNNERTKFNDYWWWRYDVESRVAFLDRLIGMYEYDDANILDSDFVEDIKEKIRNYRLSD